MTNSTCDSSLLDSLSSRLRSAERGNLTVLLAPLTTRLMVVGPLGASSAWSPAVKGPDSLNLKLD
jgi:hypothetical protein